MTNAGGSAHRRATVAVLLQAARERRRARPHRPWLLLARLPGHMVMQAHMVHGPRPWLAVRLPGIKALLRRRLLLLLLLLLQLLLVPLGLGGGAGAAALQVRECLHLRLWRVDGPLLLQLLLCKYLPRCACPRPRRHRHNLLLLLLLWLLRWRLCCVLRRRQLRATWMAWIRRCLLRRA